MNDNPTSDLPMPSEANENITLDVGAALVGDQPALWLRAVERTEAGHPEVRCVVWMTPEEALLLSRRIRDIALELPSSTPDDSD